MHFRSVLSGTLALLLVSSVAALAGGTGASGNEQQPPKGGFSFQLPTLKLPGIFGERKKPDQVQFAQDGTGTTALEEQLRRMNGKIEELNFQVLQMQEQIRKQQEDNEFRFQQLEGGSQGAQQPAEQKKSDATTKTDSSVAEAPAIHAPADAGSPPAGDQSGEVIVESPTGEPGTVIPGAPPKTFGTITVDKNGNVIDADGNTQAHAPAQNTAPATSDQAPGDQAAGTQAG
ncbi:MAG: tol-pal system protein YbgF, partial [Mesorhizobium sp.]